MSIRRRVIDYRGIVQVRHFKSVKRFNADHRKTKKGFVLIGKAAEREGDRRLKREIKKVGIPNFIKALAELANKQNVDNKITLYVYETEDDNGKTLELDVVFDIVTGEGEFEDEKLIELCIGYLESRHYGGLARAFKNAAGKFKVGIEPTITDKERGDVEVQRFFINHKDYAKSIKEGVSTGKTKGQKGL